MSGHGDGPVIGLMDNGREPMREGVAVPRKIRQLKADLREAGFLAQARRGKGSHDLWTHPDFPAARVLLSGEDGEDAKPYQERDVREAIALVRTRLLP